MSRHILEIEEGTIAYGYDRPTQCYFLQIFNYKGDMVKELQTPTFYEPEGCHRTEIYSWISNCNAPEDHRKRILLDLAL